MSDSSWHGDDDYWKDMSLFPHQPEGIKHLLSKPFNKPHALLADSPGTGKTVMTIAAAKEAGCTNGLIICPAIIKPQWKRQMLKWQLAHEDEIQILYGYNTKVTNAPWIIANYELARSPNIRQQLTARKWHCVVLDEAQRLKTHKSQQTQSVFNKDYGIGQHAYWKWALSGTIIPNRPAELYPVLKTMAPEVIRPHASWADYLKHFCNGDPRGASNIRELTERIQPFMLRRELKDVWADCPEILDQEVYVDVPYHKHKEWWAVKQNIIDTFPLQLDDLQLNDMVEGSLQSATLRRIIAESKAPYVASYVVDRLESGVDKIVIFTFHKEMTVQLVDLLKVYNPVAIYGGISEANRVKYMERFTTDRETEGNCQVFIAQIISSGEGVDGLQHVCNEVVLAEPEWSPGREDQAIDRIRRIGQTKPVIVTKLLAANSFEQVIEKTNRKKRTVINIILEPNGGTFDMATTKKEKYTIEENVQRIADALEMLANGQATVLGKIGGMEQPVQQFAPAPVGAVPQPIVTPPNVMQFPTEPVTPAMPQSVPAAAVAMAPAPTPVGANTANKEQFIHTVTQLMQPYGEAGVEKVKKTNQMFGVNYLRDVPEANYPQYLSTLQAV